MSTSSHTPPAIVTEAATFIGIDYHKKYSVYHDVDAAGRDLDKGRIEHHSPHDFAKLEKRWPNPRVVFEASMNWHWLYEVLEQSMPSERITLANAYKTRIIAEAQVKTDKIDARILALLLRAGLVSSVRIPCKETRQRKEVLRHGEGILAAKPGHCQSSGTLTPANLDAMKRGKSPLVTLGPYPGEIAEVDHILPVAKFPQYGKEFWNLELMPQSLNRRKGDTVGQRQMDLLRKLVP